jgi:hypothetical protein
MDFTVISIFSLLLFGKKGALQNNEATHPVTYYFDMFPPGTRYNFLQQFRYAGLHRLDML